MAESVFRRLLRRVFQGFRDVDDWVSHWAGMWLPRQYQVTGTCKQRGLCCRRIGVAINPTLWRFQFIRRYINWYYDLVYSFDWIGDDTNYHTILFRCRHLLPDGKCGIYHRRPMICRAYPRPRYFGAPTTLPGCGFHVNPTPSKGKK